MWFQVSECRQLLILSIHVTGIKFMEVVASIIHVWMEFLGDLNNSSTLDAVPFIW
jgi:coatomer subunit beta